MTYHWLKIADGATTMSKHMTATQNTNEFGTGPVRLAPAHAKQVSGGGANVRHGNPGGGPASYNTPGNPDYGQTRDTVRAD
jgi:hypothetical protein